MSLGDEEHPISILFETEQRGDHVLVTVRSGQKGMRALAGSFVLRRIEWLVLRDNLRYSQPISDRLAASFVESGVRSGLRIVHYDTDPIEITETSVRERDDELFARLDEAAPVGPEGTAP